MNISHLNNIQNMFDEVVAQNKVAGLNCVIYKDNKELGYWQSGYADVENKKPFNRNTIARLYSMSKPVTNVAAWILIEQGKLELCDEIDKFIPEYRELTVCSDSGKNGKPHKAFRRITVQDLLNMTSGYTYGAWCDESPCGEHLTSELIGELNKDVTSDFKITTMEVARRLAKIPVSFEPGTDYNYGLSADILGAVIEVVSGMKLSDFMKKNIFEPLGMNDTAFYVPEEKQERLANVYKTEEVEQNKYTLSLFESPNLGIQPFMNHEPAFESGGAGLCSTLDDYLKFAQMLLNGGEFNGRRILQKKTVEYFANARLRADLQQRFDQKMGHLCGYTYCNLMRVAYEKGRCNVITENDEFGWDGWLGPYVSVDLQNNLIIVMLMQKTDSGTWEATRKLKNIVYSAI